MQIKPAIKSLLNFLPSTPANRCQKDNHPKDVILTEDEMIEFIQKLIDEHITIYDVFSKRFKY